MEFSGQNTGVGSLSHLQGIFPTQGSNRFPTLQVDSWPAEPQGKPLDNYKILLTGVLSPPFIIFSIFRRQCDLLKTEIRCHFPISVHSYSTEIISIHHTVAEPTLQDIAPAASPGLIPAPLPHSHWVTGSLVFSLFPEYITLHLLFQGLGTCCSRFLEGSFIHFSNGWLLVLWFSTQMAHPGGVICHTFSMYSMGGSNGKESACNVQDLGLIPGSGWSPGEGNGNPLQYSCQRIPWTEEPGGLPSMASQRVNWTRLSH